jgi:hypothetical protein
VYAIAPMTGYPASHPNVRTSAHAIHGAATAMATRLRTSARG